MINLLYRRFYPSLLRIFKIKKKIKINNFVLYLNLQNSIEREIFLKKNYEKKEIQNLISAHKKYKFKYFIDVGSYIGYFALFIEFNTNIKKIYSFEPNKLNYRILKKNLKLNESTIKPFNLGLSNSNKVQKMWFTEHNKLGGSSVYFNDDVELKKYKKSKIKFTKIKTYKLDHLIKEINKTILIKIDVERYELFVLLGAKKLLKNNKIYLMVEIFDSLKVQIFSYLKKNDFKFQKRINSNYFFKNF